MDTCQKVYGIWLCIGSYYIGGRHATFAEAALAAKATGFECRIDAMGGISCLPLASYSPTTGYKCFHPCPEEIQAWVVAQSL